MKPAEHYVKAESLIETVENKGTFDSNFLMAQLALAQIHATLATAEPTPRKHEFRGFITEARR